MTFKFVGKKTLIVDTLTPDNVYEILQFEQRKTYLCIYVIDDKERVIRIPYSNLDNFNKNWKPIKMGN